MQDVTHATTHDSEEGARKLDVSIWVNGQLAPRVEAKVSVCGSGFLLGDGKWEGMRPHHGVRAFFDKHMDRLFDPCRAVSLDVGLDRAGIADALARTSEANGMTDDVCCRLMDTRGVKVKPSRHACDFLVRRRGKVWTSSGDYRMNGVTKQKVIELCRAAGIPVFERSLSLFDVYGASEAFLTGTFGAQSPVAEIDGKPLGDGTAGPVTRRIQGLYRDPARDHVAERRTLPDP